MQIYRMMILLVPDADLQEYHEITPPSKRPKLLSRVASLIEEKKKQSNNSTSLSSEEKEARTVLI